MSEGKKGNGTRRALNRAAASGTTPDPKGEGKKARARMRGSR